MIRENQEVYESATALAMLENQQVDLPVNAKEGPFRLNAGGAVVVVGGVGGVVVLKSLEPGTASQRVVNDALPGSVAEMEDIQPLSFALARGLGE
jgi:hypothetical protein